MQIAPRRSDRFKFAAGARLSLVYIANGRQEIWDGSAWFDTGIIESKASVGGGKRARESDSHQT